MRVGNGYDVHKLVGGRPLILCGVNVPYEKGLLGHSDADVATHALIESLAGAAALGDIGALFPDNDEKYKDISSIILLKETMKFVAQKGYSLVNADIVIAAEAPKLRPYIEEMRSVLSAAMQTGIDSINIKATTTEKLGFVGQGLGMEAYAVCLLKKLEV